MKKQKTNKLCCLLMCIVVFTLFLTTSVLADSITTMDVLNCSDTDTETDEDSAEDTVYSLLRGSDLNYGTSRIRELSSGTVNVNGRTQCHNTCDTVYVYLYLERKVNGVYSTYKYWKFSKSDATSIDKSVNVIVPTGYYYRVRGYHATSNDGRSESASTLTDGIWVD